MNFQLLNVPKPNSVNNTCVFSAFQASDTVNNLHVALDQYTDQVAELQTLQWK